MNMRRWRGLCALIVVVALPVAGLLFHTGTGTLSALGFDSVAALCPVGALEAMLGAKSVVAHGLICLGITVLVVVALGKVLCAWAYPVPWLQKFFRGKKSEGEGAGGAAADGGASRDPQIAHAETASGGEGGKEAPKFDGAQTVASVSDDQASTAPALTCSAECRSCASHRISNGAPSTQALPPCGGKRDGVRVDSRHVILAGALGSSALFGFPVFCLLCPVGLTFATLIGLWQLFSLNETSWGLIVFPAILILEVTVLRKWCTKICPISALLSLIASANRMFRPAVSPEHCLRERGIDCTACVDACPEQVDPHSALIPECSKCGRCAEACPAHAITFPMLRPSRRHQREPLDAAPDAENLQEQNA